MKVIDFQVKELQLVFRRRGFMLFIYLFVILHSHALQFVCIQTPYFRARRLCAYRIKFGLHLKLFLMFFFCLEKRPFLVL